MLIKKINIIKLLSLIIMINTFGFINLNHNSVFNNFQTKKIKQHKKVVVKKVLLKNIAFVPKIITIKPGTKVKWINKDTAMHTVISGTPKKTTDVFESNNLGLGGTFEFTFKKKGIYRYYCGTHPTQMKAIVIVK